MLHELISYHIVLYCIQYIIYIDNRQYNTQQSTMMQAVNKAKKILKLTQLDSHESLPFVQKNLNVLPSSIALGAIVVVGLIILIADGTQFIAGVVCFLLPAKQCMLAIGSLLDKKINGQSSVIEREKNSNQNQNQNITDEEYSRLAERTTQQLIVSLSQKYVIYFICYGVMEVATEFMLFFINSVVMMFVRILVMVLLLHPKYAFLSKIKSKIMSQQFSISQKQENPQFQRRDASFTEKKTQ